VAKVCEDCGEKFLSLQEYNNHKQRHLQTHLDKRSMVNEKKHWKASISDIPDGLNRELYKVFDKAMLCLWKNAQLNCALREPAREYELQTRLKEWLQE
jgi:hypothetical protein